MTSRYESAFLRCENQEALLVHLLVDNVYLFDINVDEGCSVCCERLGNHLRIIFNTASNILLNNYTKMKNNLRTAIKSKPSSSNVKLKTSSKRKLSTLMK